MRTTSSTDPAARPPRRPRVAGRLQAVAAASLVLGWLPPLTGAGAVALAQAAGPAAALCTAGAGEASKPPASVDPMESAPDLDSQSASDSPADTRLVWVGPSGTEQVVDEPGTLVRRGYLGVELTELTPELRTHFGAPAESGVMIARVVAGSPADHAGLRVGDILTALDGVPMASSWDVRARVRPLDDGAPLAIEVRRDGATQLLTAAVEQRERREVDYAPLMMHTGGVDRILPLNAPPTSPTTTEESAPCAASPSTRTAKTARELLLEKKLKALEKRLNELESRIPKS